MKRLQVIASDEARRFDLPQFHTRGAAAIDLRALLNSPLTIEKLGDRFMDRSPDGRIRSIALAPGEQVTIDCGLRIHINDPELCALILPRSSSGKKGLVLANGTGLIDSDYQGPLLLMLWNRSNEPIVIEDGDRVAQYMLTNAYQFGLTFVPEFSSTTERGEGGFGSTGSK